MHHMLGAAGGPLPTPAHLPWRCCSLCLASAGGTLSDICRLSCAMCLCLAKRRWGPVHVEHLVPANELASDGKRYKVGCKTRIAVLGSSPLSSCCCSSGQRCARVSASVFTLCRGGACCTASGLSMRRLSHALTRSSCHWVLLHHSSPVPWQWGIVHLARLEQHVHTNLSCSVHCLSILHKALLPMPLLPWQWGIVHFERLEDAQAAKRDLDRQVRIFGLAFPPIAA